VFLVVSFASCSKCMQCCMSFQLCNKQAGCIYIFSAFSVFSTTIFNTSVNCSCSVACALLQLKKDFFVSL